MGMRLIQITKKRHCEEIPVKNKYVISEAIPETQMNALVLRGLLQLYRVYFLYFEKLRNDAICGGK
jgi:hypothetical protein